MDTTPIKLEVGDQAPFFTTTLQDGSTFDLKEQLTSYKYVMLVFYPGDDTPGCTKQLCGINDVYSEFKDRGVRVLGINKASADSHQKFIDKYSYQFDIAIDEGNVIRDLYGATKLFFGNVTVKRGVVLINSEGKIIYKFWGQQDNAKVLQAIDA